MDGGRGTAGRVVVVTGAPGAGKSTLGRAIAALLGAEFVSLDTIKEALYDDGISVDDRFALRLLAEARMWEQVAAADHGAVVDIWIAPWRDATRVVGRLQALGRPVAEVLCRVPVEIAVARYAARDRSGVHLPPTKATLDRTREAVEVFEPMGFCPCLEVDTSSPVDAAAVVEWLAAV